MKKLIVFLTAIFTLSVTALCFAADGDDLNKQQAAAQVFINAFTDNAPVYSAFAANFDDSLKTRVTRQAYRVLQQQVEERFGNLRESKFYSYQRYDEHDYVTYIASFTKEKLVSITMAFNKNDRMIDFALSPLQQREEK